MYKLCNMLAIVVSSIDINPSIMSVGNYFLRILARFKLLDYQYCLVYRLGLILSTVDTTYVYLLNFIFIKQLLQGFILQILIVSMIYPHVDMFLKSKFNSTFYHIPQLCFTRLFLISYKYLQFTILKLCIFSYSVSTGAILQLLVCLNSKFLGNKHSKYLLSMHSISLQLSCSKLT